MPLIHQWRFNGNLEDSIGNLDFSNTRNLVTFTNGISQQCLQFQSGSHGPQTSGVFTSQNPLPSTPNAPWSIAFWIKDVEEDVFLTLVDSSGYRLYFSRNTENNTFTVGFDNDTIAAPAIIKLGTNSIKNQWAHFVFVYRGNSLFPKLYLNGVEQTGSDLDFAQPFSTQNISDQYNSLYITNTSGGYQMEDLRIYDEAINDAEVVKIYNSACSEITTETQITILTQPNGQYAKFALTTQPVVQIKNASNQVVSTSDLIITATVSNSGVLLGTTSVKAINGVATFTDLAIKDAGTYTITFSNPCLTSATSNALTLTTFIGTADLNIPDFTLFIKSSETDSLNLYIRGHARYPKILTLYTLSGITKGLNLYILGQNKSSGSLNLYTFGATKNGSSLNLVIQCEKRVGKKFNLFLKSTIQSNPINLYMMAAMPRPSLIDLFIIGGPSTGSINLFTESKEFLDMNLYTRSYPENKINLYINSDYQGILPLYISGPKPSYSSNGLNLFLHPKNQGENSIRFFNNLNLFIDARFGNSFPLHMTVDDIGISQNLMPLHTKSLIPIYNINKGINLSLYNDIVIANNSLTTFIDGAGINPGYIPYSLGMPLHMARDAEYYSYIINLIINGKLNSTSSLNLFTKSFNISSGQINLVLPIISIPNNSPLELYTHGYEVT